MDLAATARLLIQGGDARLALDADGSNAYGCPPRPDPERLAFGSSTASVISPAAFAAADALRVRLELPGAAALEIARQRDRLARLCGLPADAGVDIVFAASGTDIHLIATQAVLDDDGPPPLVIMMEGGETGSGVAHAVAGRHFNHRTALGATVATGEAISAPAREVVAVRLRQADGRPRPGADIDAEVAQLAAAAARAGRRILLILIDQSKTGLIAPGPDLAARLYRQHDRLEVLVDACQFRLAPATLQRYLAQGFMVALTGSKFVTGPAFSGALLLPAAVSGRLRERPLHPALRTYSSRLDWPAGWAAAHPLPEVPNPGLMLRWEAALDELERFRKVPEHSARAILLECSTTLQTALTAVPDLMPLATPPLARGSFATPGSWDAIPTIFPFVPCRRGRPLSREATAGIYRRMLDDLGGAVAASEVPGPQALRCQLGQPVACGEIAGQPVSALRLCLSARHVVAAAAGNGQAVIDQAQAAIEKMVRLTARSPD